MYPAIDRHHRHYPHYCRCRRHRYLTIQTDHGGMRPACPEHHPYPYLKRVHTYSRTHRCKKCSRGFYYQCYCAGRNPPCLRSCRSHSLPRYKVVVAIECDRPSDIISGPARRRSPAVAAVPLQLRDEDVFVTKGGTLVHASTWGKVSRAIEGTGDVHPATTVDGQSVAFVAVTRPISTCPVIGSCPAVATVTVVLGDEDIPIRI